MEYYRTAAVTPVTIAVNNKLSIPHSLSFNMTLGIWFVILSIRRSGA